MCKILIGNDIFISPVCSDTFLIFLGDLVMLYHPLKPIDVSLTMNKVDALAELRIQDYIKGSSLFLYIIA